MDASISGPPLPPVAMTTAVDGGDRGAEGGCWGRGVGARIEETGVAGVCASPVSSFGRMGAEGTPTQPRHSFPCFPQFCFFKYGI